MSSHEPARTFDAIWGIYQADGGVMGELAYVVGKIMGTAHCSLCDITHGKISKKASFKALERELGVPLHLVHLNERTPALAAATEGRTPIVVGELDGRFQDLLTAEALDRQGGSVERFREELLTALAGAAGMPAGVPDGERQPGDV